MNWLPAEGAHASPIMCMNALRPTQSLCALKAVGHVATRRQHDAAQGSQADRAFILGAQLDSWHSSKRGQHTTAWCACRSL